MVAGAALATNTPTIDVGGTRELGGGETAAVGAVETVSEASVSFRISSKDGASAKSSSSSDSARIASRESAAIVR